MLPVILLLVGAACCAGSDSPIGEAAETAISQLEGAGMDSDVKRWLVGAIVGCVIGVILKKMATMFPKFLGTAILITAIAAYSAAGSNGAEVQLGAAAAGSALGLKDIIQKRAPGLAGGGALGLLAGFNLFG